MKQTLLKVMLTSAFLALSVVPAWAEVKLPPILSNNMVTQQGKKINIWGTADTGEKVTVKLGERQAETVADANGKWRVTLDPLPASSQPLEMTVTGRNTVTVKNILVGETWLCSGQSNMAWTLSACGFSEKDNLLQNNLAQVPATTAGYPELRFFEAKPFVNPWVWQALAQPQDDVSGGWVVCTPKTALNFSAVGFFFGRKLHADLKVPVGVIVSALGGTGIEGWIPRDVYLNDPGLERPRAFEAERYAKGKQDYPRRVEEWKAKKEKVLAANPAATEKEWGGAEPGGPVDPVENYGPLYNGYIAPLASFSIHGIAWYQGESSGWVYCFYREKLAALIRGWRKGCGEEVCFLSVQLPTGDWAAEGQLKSLELPNTGLAVTFDTAIGDRLHPVNKQPVGERLALAAEGIACGKKIVYSGPIFKELKEEGNKLRVIFTHTGSGLKTMGLTNWNATGKNVYSVNPAEFKPEFIEEKKVTGFTIAGADKKFMPAEAVIDGNTVLLGSDKVATPKFVRYCFFGAPLGNLFNQEGLPASPFRSGE